jgi:hypothetical protein
MPDLETKILIDAMRTYFHHRDLALSYQREFHSAQKAFVKGLLDSGHTREEIREAAADFTKGSHQHDQLVFCVKEAARALRVAHSWYVRQSVTGIDPDPHESADLGSDAALPPLFSFR